LTYAFSIVRSTTVADMVICCHSDNSGETFYGAKCCGDNNGAVRTGKLRLLRFWSIVVVLLCGGDISLQYILWLLASFLTFFIARFLVQQSGRSTIRGELFSSLKMHDGGPPDLEGGKESTRSPPRQTLVLVAVVVHSLLPHWSWHDK
jgi:hypothetical protein